MGKQSVLAAGRVDNLVSSMGNHLQKFVLVGGYVASLVLTYSGKTTRKPFVCC